MTLREREILNTAFEALRNSMSLPDVSIVNDGKNECDRYDAIVRILNVEFLSDIKSSVTTATVGRIIDQIKKNLQNDDRPWLLVAKYISPSVVELLSSNGINSLDCAGNCYIRYEKNGRLIFQLINKGEKNPYASQPTYPLFQEAGLKVVFYLLQKKNNVGKPYREIQAATGVSLGAIKNVFSVMTERNYILNSGKERFLKNRRVLLDLWVDNYNLFLKPKLLMGRMAFRTSEHRTMWRSIELPDGMYWGGEAAANMIDDYLHPGSFDIYTDQPTAYLLKSGFVKMDANGEIKIYRKFWQWETEGRMVPLILIYADLMGSGNSRCVEEANRLMEYGLSDFE